MKTGHVALLVLFSVLLALSALIGQIAYRAERTVLSYSFMSRRLDALIAPIDDPDVHRRTVNGAFRFFRTQLQVRVPAVLESALVAASVEGFSPQWFRQSAVRIVSNTLAVLNGRETVLTLPITVSGFKNAFVQRASAMTSTRDLAQLEREVSRIPNTIDLAEQIDSKVRMSMVSVGANSRTYLVLLEYIVPVVLALLCLSLRKLGGGLIAAGAGLTASGLLVLYLVQAVALSRGPAIRRAIEQALPDFFRWSADGLTSIAMEIARGAVPLAVTVAISGAVLVAVGVVVVLKKRDPSVEPAD